MEADVMTPMVKRISITGIPIDHVQDENLEAVAQNLAGREDPQQIIFLSLWDLLRARRSKEFRRCVEQSALVVPTSKGIQRAARFLGRTVPTRYMPFEFVIRFLGALENRERSLYLLGCTPLEMKNIEQNLRQTFPGLKIVGRYTGHYPKTMENDICTAIKKASPHCVLIGSGIRGKDEWISRHKKEFSQGVFIWNSVVMDIISGKRKKISREIFQKGREFIPDLIHHPWRVFRGISYLYFCLLLFIYRFKKN